jgi:hypothetical protein
MSRPLLFKQKGAAASFYLAAASNRALLSAGPNTASTSKMPGDAVEPVSATRSG